MAKLLFKLNNVPDDEADEVRALLEQNSIDYYETSSGSFGLTFAAIWLKNDIQLVQAKDLIEQYQLDRHIRVSEYHQALRKSGENITYWQAFKQSPIKIPMAIVFVTVIFYFSTVPFFLAKL